MTLLDANILLYAYNKSSPEHKTLAAWLGALLSGTEPVCLPWVTLWAFVCIATNSRIWPNPKSSDECFSIIRQLLAQPRVAIIEPGERHAEILETLLIEQRVAGPLVTDAVLAALAIEVGAVLASTDRKFSRFGNLRWLNPLS